MPKKNYRLIYPPATAFALTDQLIGFKDATNKGMWRFSGQILLNGLLPSAVPVGGGYLRKDDVTGGLSWVAVAGGGIGSIGGTANQVIVTPDAPGAVVLSLPQNIATTSDVRFGRLGIGTAPAYRLTVGGAPVSGAMVYILCDSVVTDDKGVVVNMLATEVSTVVGASFLLNARDGASFDFGNFCGTNTNAHAYASYYTFAGGGDPYVRFLAYGPAAFWAWGADASDAGKMKLTAATTLGGSNDVLEVHPTDRRLRPLTPVEFPEQGASPAGVANAVLLFSRDNGSGKTQVCVQFPSGTVQVLTEDF